MKVKKFKKILGKILYELIGVHLPGSYSRFNLGSRKFREFCGKLMLDFCGNNVNIEKGAQFCEHISLGDNSGLGFNCQIENHVTIGKYVMMGPGCRIFTQNHAFERIDIPMQQQGFSKPKPVIIGDDVWLGSDVIILPGVSIGQGSIIGAGSVVTKSVEEYSVVGGNPARVIKKRK